jgi:heat shock protein HslJ
MRSSRLIPLLAVAVASVASLTACGGDDDTATPSAGDLDGRTFVATDIEGHTIVEGSEVVISFADGLVVVEAGCNSQRGDYDVDDGVLAVGELAMTMMACDEPLMTQDSLLATILAAGPTVELDGEALVLRNDTGTITMNERS